MFPDLFNLDRLVIGFTLVFFRVAGLMLYAPLFGSARVPRRFKMLIALVMAMSMSLSHDFSKFPPPESIGALTVGLIGEILFGFAMGMTLSLIFVAAQWAGEMIGQQIGINVGEVFDPAFGGGTSVIGDLYFMLTTAIFLIIGGHRQLVLGTFESLQAMPPLQLLFSANLFDFLLDFLMGVTSLAMRLAAPMFVTMIVVDVAMGCISKTIPQLNVMSAGMAIRGMLGVIVMILGIGVAAAIIHDELGDAVMTVRELFVSGKQT